MTDSQDEMNRTLRFTTTPEERKIIRDRLNSFTNPLGKRGAVASLGGGATTKHENLLIVGKSAHIFSHHSPLSYNLNKQGGKNGKH